MGTHLFVGVSAMDFPGDGTFAGFSCEPGAVVEDDDNWQAFAAAQPETVGRYFDDTTTGPADPPAEA